MADYGTGGQGYTASFELQPASYSVDTSTGIDQTRAYSEGQKLDQIVTFSAPGAVLGLADTMWSSTFGSDGDIPAIAQNWGAFGQFYNQNREGLRMAGDAAGMFVPWMVASKAISGAGWLARAAEFADVKAVKNIFDSGHTYYELTAKVRRADQLAARSGVINFAADPARKALVNEALTTGVADVVKRVVATEGLSYALMNNSDVLYPKEFTLAENLALNVGLAGIGGAIETAMLKRTMTNSIQKVAPEAYAVRNPVGASSGVYMDETIARGVTETGDGDRSALITLGGLENANLRLGLNGALEKGDTRMATAFGDQIRANDAVVKKQIEQLGRDNPIQGVNKQTSLSPQQVQNVRSSLEDDPTLMLNATSLDHAPRSLDDRKIGRAHV